MYVRAPRGEALEGQRPQPPELLQASANILYYKLI